MIGPKYIGVEYSKVLHDPGDGIDEPKERGYGHKGNS
jgi:hypothetical protein